MTLRWGVALLVVAVVVLSGCSSPDGTTPSPAAASTNADGLTYGSALGAADRDAEPDLIQVETDDGTVGYVRKVDLYADEPANPTEAVEQQARRDEASVSAALDAVTTELGAGPATSVDVAAGTAALDAIQEAVVTGSATARATELLDALLAAGGITAARPAGTDDAALCALALDRAAAVNVRVVPVYESDGRTVIGEFPVGG
ncbi:hypothetical protein [Cellulomonas fimi]|uniref:Lipoprotein n=1 Tax=Cellulomonas fimi (strain ATCC 484 / DSM 20113 / JCM 1341 / CCUG 24087 / LMG 16345 / NBRC 15513 / NCIMB 8980 / NCTC 7547 / NRS-133) TaxID=590998 RepID=F4H279_CELFA|nr:hypothetical protein [Cellulomonas fimi]AEE46376.1 hypothetical protein Celf_2248 [Cellulomonas fimi ATCC 484]NNH07176.1 hypothetical protein [Cellulomonas fimi]VEH32744.1 Uncharacterised protein [Cellulomonas fimi]